MKKLTYNDLTHEYFLDDIKIPSVTTLLGGGGGGKGTTNGNIFHEAMTKYFATLDKTVFQDINPDDKPIISNVANVMKQYSLTPYVSEKIVSSNLENNYYAGTIDLTLKSENVENAVIDYKTGITKDTLKHSLQIVAYMNSINAKYGFVVYRDEIITIVRDSTEYHLLLSTFTDLLLAYNGKKQGYTWYKGKIYKENELIKTISAEYKYLDHQIKELEENKKHIKEQIALELKKSGEKAYRDNNILASYTKESIRHELKKEAKKELLEVTPEFFSIKHIDKQLKITIQG